MKKRKMIVQIALRNGKTIDDFVRFHNNFISTPVLEIIRGYKTPEGVKYELYHNLVAEKYIKELKEDGFKITVNQ